MRVVSLLPAATEIVGALGLFDQVVGVSHECDYPAAARTKPKVTACAIHGKDVASRDIDAWVSTTLAAGGDLFTLDEPTLRRLRPELILTQKLCDVCAPAYGSVAALAQALPEPPRVLNLEPSSLQDILGNIHEVAVAMGVERAAEPVLADLRRRIEDVRQRTASVKSRPRVAVIEWLDPVFCSGHWTPELVEIAGGQEVLGRKGQDSVRLSWTDVAAARPDILVIACCGQDAERARVDWERVKDIPEVKSLPAVGAGNVHIVDGNAYFSRPGPRVVEALEMLVDMIHPRQAAGRVFFEPRGSHPADT
jgi:iron complex transport system substrate-binding protein